MPDGLHLLRLVKTLCSKLAVRDIDDLDNELLNCPGGAFYHGDTGGAVGNAARTRHVTQFLLERRYFAREKLAHAVQELSAVIPVQGLVKCQRGLFNILPVKKTVECGIGQLDLPGRRDKRHAMGRRGERATETLVAPRRSNLRNLLVGDVVQQADGPLNAALVAAIGIHRQRNGSQCAILAVHKHFFAPAQPGLQILRIDRGDEMRARLRRQKFIEGFSNDIGRHVAQNFTPLAINRAQPAGSVHGMHHEWEIEQQLLVNLAILVRKKWRQGVGLHLFPLNFPAWPLGSQFIPARERGNRAGRRRGSAHVVNSL